MKASVLPVLVLNVLCVKAFVNPVYVTEIQDRRSIVLSSSRRGDTVDRLTVSHKKFLEHVEDLT